MIPLRPDGGLLRLVHRANSLAGIEAALAAGLDGLELDVISAGGRLVLAHSPKELEPGAPTLDEALALAGDAIVLVDLKQARIEAAVVDALRGRERSVVCALEAEWLRTVRRLEPSLPTSLSYPADRFGVSKRGLPGPVLGATVATLRTALPYRIERKLGRAWADAATLHHLVLSRRTVERCHARGFAVIAWTVNDPAELERMTALGVDGVVTDDPGVFERATIAPSCGA